MFQVCRHTKRGSALNNYMRDAYEEIATALSLNEAEKRLLLRSEMKKHNKKRWLGNRCPPRRNTSPTSSKPNSSAPIGRAERASGQNQDCKHHFFNLSRNCFRSFAIFGAMTTRQ